MTIYQLPYFGEVSLLEQDYYEIEADINQADTQIILDIPNINPTKEEVSEIQLFLKSLPCLDTKIREAFLNEYISEKPSFVKDYIRIQIRDNREVLEEELGLNVNSSGIGKDFCSKMELQSIFICPESTAFAVFEYTIGQMITEDVLTVGVDKQGNIMDFSVES